MKPPVPLEDVEDEIFANYCRAKGYFFSHIANETSIKNWGYLTKMKRIGKNAGVPDFLVIIPNKNGSIDTLVFIEMKRKDAAAAKAGEHHDQEVQTVHDTTREIIRTVTIPAASDPYLPVGFVRLFDRAAGRSIGADPYPGKSDGDASDVRVSEAASLLVGNYDKCETNRVQLADLIAYLKSDREPAKRPDFLDRINPFN